MTATKGWTARTQTFGRSDGDTWTLGRSRMRRRGDGTPGPALPHGRDRFLSDEIDKLKAVHGRHRRRACTPAGAA
ncbi:MAG: hypothetical protein R2838_05450 [Caldilineaceae bacterium]